MNSREVHLFMSGYTLFISYSESEQSYQSMISEVEEEVRVTDDGLLQVHGQDQVKLQVCLNVVDITYYSAWLIVVLFTAE